MRMSMKRTLGSSSRYEGGIIGSKNQAKEKRSQQVMTLFERQTVVTPNADELPVAKLKADADLAVYNTPNLPEDFSPDIQLMWSMASALYKMDKTKDRFALFDWLRELVKPGLEYQMERQTKIHGDDAFLPAFVYLTFGQTQLALAEIHKLKDPELALYISLFGSATELPAVEDKLSMLQTSIKWRQMSTFQKKCWFIASGHLGFIQRENFSVTEGIYWQCVLSMYIWYGRGFRVHSNLHDYNAALQAGSSINKAIRTNTSIAAPDKDCLWYQLLQWWVGNTSVANFDSWPLELPYLLRVYKGPSNLSEEYINRFVDDLDRNDLAEWAIYASLFLDNSQKRVSHILRQCEWSDEKKLVEQYHIPRKHVQMAKALNAHDSWDYEAEYAHLLEGNLMEQAKLSLFFFLLPRIFDANDTALSKSSKFLSSYLKKQPDDKEIATLDTAYTCLLDKDSHADTTELVSELSQLQEKYNSRNCRQTLNNLIDLIQTEPERAISE